MIQDIAPLKFDNAYSPKPAKDDSYIICFRENQVLVKDPGAGLLGYPQKKDFSQDLPLVYLFSLSGRDFFLAETEEIVIPSGYAYEKTGIFRSEGPKYLGFAGITAYQLYNWYRNNRFCGRCGRKTQKDKAERMLKCPCCGNMIYPKISPAVIVAVTNGEQLLLTKYAGRAFKRYALIAGFTEIGETLEQTVQREVMEEVGLRVKNIRYYKCQPWSFTDTLLVGYYAQVDGPPEIHLDHKELAEGIWMKREDIPGKPEDMSLTNEMIMEFKAGRQS